MMGNNNTSSGLQSGSSNDSLSGGQAPFAILPEDHHGFFWPLSFTEAVFTHAMNQCHVQGDNLTWLGVKIFILLTAFPANTALMWMLLNRRGAMTPSEVLGLNVSIMDILYCLFLPLDIYTILHETSEITHSVIKALFSLNIFGCPLLLTFMCLERYIAVAQPITYVRLGRWEYRVVLCACSWILTLTVALLGYFIGMFAMVLSMSITISVLFLIMVMCLLRIMQVLCQSGPGESSGSSIPLRRRALKNILAVMVPAVVAYSPLVALVPFMAVIFSKHSKSISPTQCSILQLLLVFPNFGLFIGPMFYLSRITQVSCWTRDQQALTSRTGAE